MGIRGTSRITTAGRENVVQFVESESALPQALPEMLDAIPAPPEAKERSERLSGWFLASLAIVQLLWLGAIAYLLVLVFG